MAVLPQDVVTDLRRTIADLEQRLQSSLAENSRLQNELGAARDRQNASADILRTIASAPSEAERSLYQIAETSARLFAATSATIQIAEGDGWSQIIRVGESSKRVGAGVPESQLRIGGRNMPGTIVAENRQVHVPDVDNVDPAIADWPGLPYVRAAGTRSMAGAPLRLEGNAIGALIVYRDRLAPFTDEELALQQSFADQAAIAIENSRLFHETREALERQTATAEILKVIARSPSDVQPVFAAIAESAKRLLGGFSTTVLRFIGEELHLVAYTPTNPAADQALKACFPRLLAEFPTFSLVRNGETVQFADIESEHVPSANRELGRLRGFRSVLFTPLMNQGMPVGMISVTRAEPGAFAAHHIQLLETFADQAVIAIENVRLFNELQQRTRDLSEALTYQTGSGNILRVIASSPTDVKPVLNAIVESACELCEADDALVALRDGEDLVFKAQHGSIPVVWDRQPIDHYGPAGRAVIDRAPVQVHDLLAPEGEQFPRAQEFARRTNVRTVLCVPLLREGEGTGVIVLRRTEVRPFSDKQITLLKTFADQAVIAIGNVRLFQQVQQRTRELAASLDELRMAQDRLVQTEKLASLGQLTAGIAHEIKNPLNFVNNFAALSAELTDELNDVLRPASLGAKAREEVDELTGMLKDNLQKVVQHGKRADSIVKNMLLHSREGSGEHRLSDINALIDESLNLAYHGARAEKPNFNVTLQREFDPAAGMVEVFPQEITRVFLNLISNGFYAVIKRRNEIGNSGFDPIVRATTRNLGDTVEIRIRDNGTGIPPDVREKMFNPFFTTKPAGEGTGLGLSMSHDIIVKQHGGTIDVDTEPGQFTEFRIVLPRTGNFSSKSAK